MKIFNSLFLVICSVVYTSFVSGQPLDSILRKKIKANIDSTELYLFNNPKKAIGFGSLALEYSHKLKSYNDIGDAYNLIGNAYHIMGDYKNASINYMNALRNFEDNKILKGQLSSSINLGVLYFDQSNYQKSKETYLRAIALAMSISDSLNLAGCYNNMGIVYQNEKNLDSALYYYNTALNIRKQINRGKSFTNLYINIASVYFDKKEYDKSLNFLMDVYNTDSTYNRDLLFKNIADCYIELNNYSFAKNML